MGFGGNVTLLGCKIGALNRLPASFFISVAYNCWAFRRLGVRLPEWSFAPLAFVVTLVPTLASYYLVELPCLRLKHRWESKGTSAVAPRKAAA